MPKMNFQLGKVEGEDLWAIRISVEEIDSEKNARKVLDSLKLFLGASLDVGDFDEMLEDLIKGGNDDD